MNVLVAVASKHGGTRGIADAIADELRSWDVFAAVRDVDEAITFDAYDAVVLGSAIYLGSWLPAARRFLDVNRGELAAVPVWLFSSGPLGKDGPPPPETPNHLGELMISSGARGHRLFVGSLEKQLLGFGERLAATLVHAPEGDFRDWAAIREWSRDIATAVRPATAHLGAAGEPTNLISGTNRGVAP